MYIVLNINVSADITKAISSCELRLFLWLLGTTNLCENAFFYNAKTPVKIINFLKIHNFVTDFLLSYIIFANACTVEPVYIEHSREMKKCSMYAGVQCIQVLSNWRLGEIETKSRVIRET